MNQNADYLINNLMAFAHSGSGRAPGEGNGSRLQYSCLGNPMDEEPGGLVHEVAKSRT